MVKLKMMVFGESEQVGVEAIRHVEGVGICAGRELVVVSVGGHLPPSPGVGASELVSLATQRMGVSGAADTSDRLVVKGDAEEPQTVQLRRVRPVTSRVCATSNR